MRIVATLVVALLITAVAAHAQQPKTLPLWSEQHPAPTPQVINGPEANDGIGHLANISTPEIMVYHPEKSKNTGVAMVICPGGGYGVVSTRYEGHAYAKFLAENGITGIIVKYRLPGGVHTIPMEDVQRAMQMVRERALQWGVDPHKIGISGFSAGGHLAASVATHALTAGERAYFMILFYPVITFEGEATHWWSRASLTGGDRTLDAFYSPQRHVTAATPPTLVITSLDDSVVSTENSSMMIDSLQAHGIENRYVRFPSGGHGYGFNPDFEHAAERDSATLQFIRKLTQNQK